MEAWSVHDVVGWVAGLGGGAASYQDAFLRHEIDGLTLCGLSDRDLKVDMGINELGVRRALLRGVAAYGGKRQGGGSAGYVSPPAPHDTAALRSASGGSARTVSPRSKSDPIPHAMPSHAGLHGSPESALPADVPEGAAAVHVRHSHPPSSFNLSPVPCLASSAHPLTIQCACCSHRAKLYPVSTHRHCGSCSTETEWFFVDG